MSKYHSINCHEHIAIESVYIEKVKVENNNLCITFKGIEISKHHPLNPYKSEWETNEAMLIFYDFEVIESGYYDCSQVTKQSVDFESDCVYVYPTFRINK
ncbi:hypothetical protein [Cytobacillus pseudoceanisediminis]|uniref:hypothetical protein n=1 Tax=Cytobacillus pseudoceanisediminis TaxID=3051614 RepID=UPI003C2BA4DC